MASPDIIDLNKLLAPIEGDSPSGSDTREDTSPLSKYQAIKAARSAARAAERKGMHDGESAEADEHWRKIITLAPDILATQSKDLEIASWLTEALIRRHGFQGLRDAFKLIDGLIANFWDTLHPLPDDEGMDSRTASLAGLNGEDGEGVLIAPIRKVPITEGQPAFSFWQYQQALDANRSANEDVRISKTEKLGFSVQDIEKAVNDSSSEFFVNLLDDVTQSINTYMSVSSQLDQKCKPSEVPPTRKIIAILEECRGAISHVGKHKLPVPVVATAEEPEASSANGAPVAKVILSSGAINSREAAFAQLIEIAKYFRKAEPHSPVSYVIEKAVKWGNMPLNELMIELISDPSSRKHYSELTGVANED